MSTPTAHRSSSPAASRTRTSLARRTVGHPRAAGLERPRPTRADASRSGALRSPAPPAGARPYSVTDNSLYNPADLGLAATRDVTLSWRTSNCAEVAELADAGDSKP